MRQPYLVHQLVEESASHAPDAPFVVHDGRSASYSEIAGRARAWAALLAGEGLRRGDRVGLLARNGELYVEAYYGILAAGCIAVPLNTALDGRGAAEQLADCSARALVAGEGFGSVVGGALPDAGSLELVLGAEDACTAARDAGRRAVGIDAARTARGLPPPAGPLIDLDVASIIYTSGSTGRPRGATLTHRNLCANTLSIVRYLGLSASDRVLAVLPFYYVYGKSLLNTHAAVGGSVVVENRFLFPNTALDTLEREQCTGLSGVPSTFAILLDRSNIAERPLEHLRYLTQAGGAMSPEHTRRLLELLPRQRLFVMYGATEASARLSYLDPDELPRKIGSIGKAIPNVELRVVKEDGSEAAPGEVGEIVARGSNIMVGYWNDPEETARVLGPGGYRTGDLARRDEEGFLYVVGRKKDMIKTGAHRIAAKEVEEAIVEHPDVHEAAVVGEPDELLGEVVAAHVVFHDPAAADRDALLLFLRGRLPAYKVPARIAVRRSLPKNEAGKIMKQALHTTGREERPAREEGQ